MGRNREKLTDTLTEQQIELLEKYDDVINEMHSIAEVESFSFGFSPWDSVGDEKRID